MDMLATVTLHSTSGFPEDEIVNSFAFQSGSVAPDIAPSELVAPLSDFYAANTAFGNSISEFLSPEVSRTVAPTLKVYDITGDLSGTPHGSPIYVSDLTGLEAAGSPTPLPGECAVVLTLRAAGWSSAAVEGPANTRPRQRHTGRIYLGPLNSNASSLVSGAARVSANLITIIGQAADRLADAAATLGGDWSVWSRADAHLLPVERVEIDNAFDVQRRRGRAATSRTIVTV